MTLMTWWEALGAAVPMGAMLGGLVAVFNSWNTS